MKKLNKRQLVENCLHKETLRRIAYDYDLPVRSNAGHTSLIEAVMKKRSITNQVVCEYMKKDELQVACALIDANKVGSKTTLLARIFGEENDFKAPLSKPTKNTIRNKPAKTASPAVRNKKKTAIRPTPSGKENSPKRVTSIQKPGGKKITYRAGKNTMQTEFSTTDIKYNHSNMDHSAHNKLVSFIWNIADDCLRDVYVRGKYRDVILPMVVLRRLDTLLEPTKEAVLEEVKYQKEEMDATELDDEPLKAASGYVFYNTSKWTLKKLSTTATNNQLILLANFEEYLNGFSDNVKEIVECFNLKAQIRHMAGKDVLLDVLEKFVSPYINLTPNPSEDPDGNKQPALTNLGMGYVFEELIRKFNEENNEEAGEHFTPREVIELMTHLVFDPLKNDLPLTITVYDPACGKRYIPTSNPTPYMFQW